VEKFFSKYFHSKEAIIRSLAAIFVVISIIFLGVVWIIATIYALGHNGQFPDLNMFYLAYCPSAVLALSWAVFYPLDHSLWLDSLRNPDHR